MGDNNQNMENETKKKIEWREQNEQILKGWADKAQCYQMLHDRAHKRYWCLNAWFAIPVIIFSTITGTGNFAQENIDPSWKAQFIFIIGSINIFSAIITTIGQFIGVAQKSEGHKLASIHWDKFSRRIKIELSKVRTERVDCNNFMETCQLEFDRLIETSPNIPSDVIRWFRKLIKEGDIDNVGGCQLCVYEYCCFPFGMECCNNKINCCCLSCFPCMNKDNSDKQSRAITGIEMPEIVGTIQPTKINTSNTDNDNEYDIYTNEHKV
jgi:hypothetical protein